MDFYCVYEHYNKKNKLIYVGFTSNFYNRHCAHNFSSKWFSKVNKIVVSHFETKKDTIDMKKTTLNKAIRKAGNCKRLAEYLGFSRQFMYQVVKGIRPFPSEHMEKIDALIGKK